MNKQQPKIFLKKKKKCLPYLRMDLRLDLCTKTWTF